MHDLFVRGMSRVAVVLDMVVYGLLQKDNAPTGNRTQGKCLEGIYVTTTPSALPLDGGRSKIYDLLRLWAYHQLHNPHTT